MSNSKVVLIPINTYDERAIYSAMSQGVELLGGIEKFVKPEEKIVVKPNFLSPAEESKAITTHPSVIKAMLRLLSEAGCKDFGFGDSPGRGSSAAAAEKLGLNESNTFGSKILSMDKEVEVDFPEGMTCNQFHFTKEIAEADAIINLCKMKTHQLEHITGAVKNVYGFICGNRKAAGHVKFPNASVFARALCDIHRCTKPRLHIMDGIIAMEGNGPGAGDPVAMNVMLFSADPVALDSVFCHLIYLNPELVPTCTQGQAMGVGTYQDITVIVPANQSASSDENHSMSNASQSHPDDTEDFVEMSLEEAAAKYGNKEFNVDRKGEGFGFLTAFSKLTTRFSRRPTIKKDLCVKCGICVNHCPIPDKAVDFKNGKDNPPVYDYSKCIRCYCCQEMCPQHAIVVK